MQYQAVLSIDHLETIATKFLDLADSLGRPMEKAELLPWEWIRTEFDRPAILADVRTLPVERCEEIAELLAMLDDAFEPLHREKIAREDAECTLFALAG